MDTLQSAAEIAVRNCMDVKPGETVLIITDEALRNIGVILWEAAQAHGAEAIFTQIIPRQSNGEEPPQAIAELMLHADVILVPTFKSLSHTDSRRNASKKGVRIATLPGITEATMIRTLNADYNEIARKSDTLAGYINRGSTVHIATELGTDITLSVEGRDALSDTGLNHNPGDFSNLPAGEAFVAPIEGTSNGTIVIDGSMAGVGLLESDNITITVEDGYATRITGGKSAKKLLSIMEPFGKLAFNVAELGIGTHDKAIITGNVLEDEKVFGTIHIAFGDNKSMGGNIRVASHLDGVITGPTLSVDGELLIDRGTHLVFET